MTRTSIHEYVAAQRPRYLAASRREKRRILDEVVAVTGYHRKAALRRLHRPARTTSRAARTGRPPVYGADVTLAAQVLWEASGEIGAVRLQPFVPELLDRLLAFGALPLTPATAAVLRRVSAATLKRQAIEERAGDAALLYPAVHLANRVLAFPGLGRAARWALRGLAGRPRTGRG